MVVLTRCQGVTRPKGCRMSIIEAVWQPKEAKEEDETPTTSGEITPSPVAGSDEEEVASAATARVAGDN